MFGKNLVFILNPNDPEKPGKKNMNIKHMFSDILTHIYFTVVLTKDANPL